MIQKQAFEQVLAATGTPPSLFTDADGTSQREGLRRYHLGTVLPLAHILEMELTEKLETPVTLAFDRYPLDMDGRSKAFAKLVQGGMEITQAAAVSGVLIGDDS